MSCPEIGFVSRIILLTSIFRAPQKLLLAKFPNLLCYKEDTGLIEELRLFITLFRET